LPAKDQAQAHKGSQRGVHNPHQRQAHWWWEAACHSEREWGTEAHQ